MARPLLGSDGDTGDTGVNGDKGDTALTVKDSDENKLSLITLYRNSGPVGESSIFPSRFCIHFKNNEFFNLKICALENLATIYQYQYAIHWIPK